MAPQKIVATPQKFVGNIVCVNFRRRVFIFVAPQKFGREGRSGDVPGTRPETYREAGGTGPPGTPSSVQGAVSAQGPVCAQVPRIRFGTRIRSGIRIRHPYPYPQWSTAGPRRRKQGLGGTGPTGTLSSAKSAAYF